MQSAPDTFFALTPKESLPFYKSLIEGTSDLVWVVDAKKHNLLVYNQAYYHYCSGRGIELITGMRSEEIMPAEYESFFKNLYETTVISGPVSKEYPIIPGELVLQLLAAPVYINDKIIGISVFAHDITDMKTIENSMKSQKEQYITLLESSHDMIWAVDADQHRLTIFNSALRDYLFKYYNVDIHIGNTPEEILSAKSARFYHELYNKAVDSGVFQLEYSTEEAAFDLAVTVTPFLVNGQITGIFVFAEDITVENKKRHELEAANEILTKRFMGTISAISKIAEVRDPFMSGHQKRVQQLACAIAQEMGLPEKTINYIYLGALVYDIGKLFIASDTLNKPGKISSQEFALMQTHAERGYEVVNEMNLPWQIPTMIYQHHERMDGSGYPLGLSGDQIILESRILAVADVVEAMTSDRPYRLALGIREALEEIRQNSGFRYDSKVSDACIKLFEVENFKFTA
jgi:HD-GYP domain-containing protein (c-di-GMP phosphodiesterase class II)